MSQNHLSAKALTAAIAAVLVLVVGITWAGATGMSPGDMSLARMGQNGNGQGNGQGQGQAPENAGQGNGNGQGQAPENAGQGNGNGQGQAPENAGQGNGNGQGQEDDVDEGEVPEDTAQGNAQGQSQAAENPGLGAENANEAAPLAAEASPEPGGDEQNAGAKIGVCHMTGSESNPAVFITINENASTAHEAHGDILDVASADECPTGDEDADEDDDAGSTPVASPVADD